MLVAVWSHLFIGTLDKDILDVEEGGDAELLFGDGERSLEDLLGRLVEQVVIVDQVGAVLVDQGGKGQTRAPRSREVLDVDACCVVAVRLGTVGFFFTPLFTLVALGLALAPEEETLLGAVVLNADAADLVVVDDGPDHAYFISSKYYF